MGINHDKLVLDWTKNISNSAISKQTNEVGDKNTNDKHTSYQPASDERGEGSSSHDRSTSGEHTNQQPNERGEGSSSCDKSTSGEHANKQPDERGKERSSRDKSTSGEDTNRQPDERGEGSSSRDKSTSDKQPDERGEGSSSRDKSTNKQPDERGEGSSSRDRSTNKQPDERGEGSSSPEKGTNKQPDERGEGSSSPEKGTNKQPDERDEGSSSRDKSTNKQPDERDEGSSSRDESTNGKHVNKQPCENSDLDIDIIPGASEEGGLPTDQTIIIIGDNWDKNIKPRDMRSNNQVKSLHLFHAIATTSRVKTLHLNDKQSIGSIRTLPVSEFLPSIDDCTAIHDNYVILVARVITANFEYFSSLRDCAKTHSP